MHQTRPQALFSSISFLLREKRYGLRRRVAANSISLALPRVETDLAGTNPHKRGIVPLSSVSPFQPATTALGRRLGSVHFVAAPFTLATTSLGCKGVFAVGEVFGAGHMGSALRVRWRFGASPLRRLRRQLSQRESQGRGKAAAGAGVLYERKWGKSMSKSHQNLIGSEKKTTICAASAHRLARRNKRCYVGLANGGRRNTDPRRPGGCREQAARGDRVGTEIPES